MQSLIEKKIGLTFAFLLLFFGAECQIDSIYRPLNYSVRLHYGYIFTHSSVLNQFANHNPAGFEVDVLRFNNRVEDYLQCNCWSYTGISAGYFNFGLPQILGSAVTLNGFAEPVLFKYKSSNLTLRLGTGFAFLNKVFDEETNSTNLFFSSRLSFTLVSGIRVRLPLNENLLLEGSCWFNHISNGGIKQPNKGMNYPTFSIGINYLPVKEFYFDTNNEGLIPPKRDRLIFLRTFFSGKVHDKTPEFPLVFCPISGITAGLSYPLGKFSIFSLSFGFEYDDYLNESLRRENKAINKLIADIALGYGVNAGNFTLLIRNGLYLQPPVNQIDNMYQQYDISYRLSKRVHAGLYFKAHRHVAEHMGVSLFYNLFVF